MTRSFARIILTACAAAILHHSAAAVPPDEQLKDAALEAKAREISKELRCLVCQNQSIDDSDAELAKDLRRVVRERLSAGDDEAAIKDFVVERYGEFVLLKPRLTAQTAILWGSPLLLVLLGIGFAGYTLRRQPHHNIEAEANNIGLPLSEDAKTVLDSLRRD
jgi:cytochrome c-type biogenesis protein CcmH